MKFTKEEVYEELVKRMTKNGETLNLTSRTLDPTLEILMKYAANDDTELSDFIDVVLPSAVAMDGQYRKEHSDFIKEWKEKHPNPEPKPSPKDNKDDKDNGSKNPELEAILDKMAKLEEKIAMDDKAKALSSKRKELEEAMEKKGIKDKEWRNDLLAEINITEDTDVESKAESFLKIYNKSKASEGEDFTPLGSSKSGNVNNANLFDDLKKDFEREEERKKDLI